MTGPLPPADLVSRDPNILTIDSGVILHRFFDADKDAIYFDRSLLGRLNSPDSSYGVLYTADGSRGAFAETFLRSPGRRQIDPSLLTRKAHARLEVVRELDRKPDLDDDWFWELADVYKMGRPPG